MKTIEEIKEMIDSNRMDLAREKAATIDPTNPFAVSKHATTIHLIKIEIVVLQWVLGEKY